jgi:hypothetical protein
MMTVMRRVFGGADWVARKTMATTRRAAREES